MRVEEFNTGTGLYIFEFDGLEADFHSHPAIEIILAIQGEFTVWTTSGAYPGLQLAIVPSNRGHKVSSANCRLKMIMIEHHDQFVADCLALADMDISKGGHWQAKYGSGENTINGMLQAIRDGRPFTQYDARVSKTIDFLDNNVVGYASMMNTLKGITHLSESRLSHLFKSNIGLSLKKYLIWAKLKSTVKQHLDAKEDLFSALIGSGFYDQPHFSKSFKNMLGVKPSRAYNSRIVQARPERHL